MNRYRNRLSALSDVMDYIDIDQTTFDQFKHLFSAPPEVPEKIPYEQFVESHREKEKKERSSIATLTGQTVDDDEPIAVHNKEPDNASNPQPGTSQDDEVKILTLRINKLDSFFPQ
jgi:hypothetical protein